MRQINWSLCCVFLCWDTVSLRQACASLKVELVRYDVWQLRQSSGFRLNASMSRSGRARQNPYGRWDGVWFPFIVADMSRRNETCRYSQEQKDVWGDSITLARLYELIALRFLRRFRLWCSMHREKCSYEWLCKKRTRIVVFDLFFHVIHFTFSFLSDVMILHFFVWCIASGKCKFLISSIASS